MPQKDPKAMQLKEIIEQLQANENITVAQSKALSRMRLPKDAPRSVTHRDLDGIEFTRSEIQWLFDLWDYHYGDRCRTTIEIGKVFGQETMLQTPKGGNV